MSMTVTDKNAQDKHDSYPEQWSTMECLRSNHETPKLLNRLERIVESEGHVFFVHPITIFLVAFAVVIKAWMDV